MTPFLWIIGSTILVSLIAFIGILTLLIKKKALENILLILVSLSAGALIGGAFLHLIPEAVEEFDNIPTLFVYVIIGFLIFFLVEKVLHWRHCHKEQCKTHTFVYMNLIGDSVHNFIDGMIIAAGFIVSVPLGLTTTMAVALHEIPQELGDFGVLVYGGFSKTKALLLNFVTALTAIIGGVVGYFLSAYSELPVIFMLPFAAGGFIYIAASDLIPEIRKETDIKRAMLNFAVMLTGILIIYALRFMEH